jgi:hypothetical protein
MVENGEYRHNIAKCSLPLKILSAFRENTFTISLARTTPVHPKGKHSVGSQSPPPPQVEGGNVGEGDPC